MIGHVLKSAALACALVAHLGQVWGQDQGQVPLRNPFEFPLPLRGEARPSPADAEGAESLILHLRATLVSKKEPLAVVGSRILAVGDEIQGYRLLSVREGEAVFTRGDGRLTLRVGVDETDDDGD